MKVIFKETTNFEDIQLFINFAQSKQLNLPLLSTHEQKYCFDLENTIVDNLIKCLKYEDATPTTHKIFSIVAESMVNYA